MCFLSFFWNKKWKQSWHWSNKKYKHAYVFSCMVVDWDLEPGNSLLYLLREVGITLSIHLLFDLQKMMNSVLHGEKGRWMHSVFYLFGAFISLFIEALAIAGSSASTKNMQKNLYLKLYAFCSERRHLPWGQKAGLGVRKVGQILYWDIRCSRNLRRSCRLHVPASSLQAPKPCGRASSNIKLSVAALQQWLAFLTFLMDLGYQEVLLKRGLYMSNHAVKWTERPCQAYVLVLMSHGSCLAEPWNRGSAKWGV